MIHPEGRAIVEQRLIHQVIVVVVHAHDLTQDQRVITAGVLICHAALDVGQRFGEKRNPGRLANADGDVVERFARQVLAGEAQSERLLLAMILSPSPHLFVATVAARTQRLRFTTM